MRAAFLAFVTISLSISVRSSGLPPSSSAYWGSGTGTRDGRDSALPQGGNIESGPSTELSLGGVFGRQGERISHVGASSSRKRPDASVGNEHDLGLSLGREGWSEEAVHQANLERAANLRRKFAHYLNYDFVLWPESSINARRYQTSLHKIRTRARSAYRLRDEFKDIIDQALGPEVWSQQAFVDWFDSLPQRAPSTRDEVSKIDKQAKKVMKEVEQIENVFRNYKA
ncbi:uncharacterized protein UMAG_11060 [Mycosarcoma maydis]|uniref:Uncharacterized protein n=1 Tax=Mycosarcoma maydis TaxID=5270 RepID=A0A0D1DUQ0_MYCMD|nr:uncharacterized protein UMAG_11060 [Ustilago maydis 521]KIS67994.1 hypothetical protein UMAG_11060 [Ustilago maydis 521]|eukprot:XP_011390542.1 hypothetical protein UMAG_11060 [Ustilago maydis 521]